MASLTLWPWQAIQAIQAIQHRRAQLLLGSA
jgi:hypothetical protein